MIPTLLIGDHLLVKKMVYGTPIYIPFTDITVFHHSFPTRRSSDLAPSGNRRVRGHLDPDELGPHVRQIVQQRAAALRSEGHTSELQSPVYIVCRLLLEIKTGVQDTVRIDDPDIAHWRPSAREEDGIRHSDLHTIYRHHRISSLFPYTTLFRSSPVWEQACSRASRPG